MPADWPSTSYGASTSAHSRSSSIWVSAPMRTVSPASSSSCTSDTTTTGLTIDTQGFESCLFNVFTGVNTDGDITVQMFDDDAAGMGTEVEVTTEAGGLVRWDTVTGNYRQFLSPQDGLPSNEVNGISRGSNANPLDDVLAGAAIPDADG